MTTPMRTIVLTTAVQVSVLFLNFSLNYETILGPRFMKNGFIPIFVTDFTLP